MFSLFTTKKTPPPIAPPPPILAPPIKTVYDMSDTEINLAIKVMEGKLNDLFKNIKPYVKKIVIDDTRISILKEQHRIGGKHKTRNIRHRFTQNRK